MIAPITHPKTSLKFSVAMLVTLLMLGAPGCGTKESPPNPETLVCKKEVVAIIRQMQQLLTDPLVKGDLAAMNAALGNLSQQTACICVDCPYKVAVLDAEGTLLTTFPNNEVVGRNFSSYKMVLEPLRKKRITQSLAYLASGAKIYFISAPLANNDKVAGLVVLALTPRDIEKWHLREKEFLGLDLNTP